MNNDKLAEEILSRHYSKILANHSKYRTSKDAIEAMQAYHEAKLKEELTLFENWRKDTMPRTFASTEYVINEYIKQRNNGNKG